MPDFETTFTERGGSFNTLFIDEKKFKTYFKEGSGLSEGKILVNTTENWNAQPQIKSQPKTIYVYSDYQQVEEDGVVKNVPGFKVGDGNAYLIDLAFTDVVMTNHVNDMDIHVTLEEKEFWNNKVRGEVTGENLTLTIN